MNSLNLFSLGSTVGAALRRDSSQSSRHKAAPTATPFLRALFAAGAGLIAATLFAAQENPPSAAPSPAPDAKPAAADYRIVPNDQIRFHITGEPDETLFQRVSSQGEISVPLLGTVKVGGLTLRETESLMEKRYRDEGFFIAPQVILGFESYAPRTVSVLGQVNTPLLVEFSLERSQMGIVNAITRAGGFTRVARTDAVKVMRTVDGKETTFTINVAAYLNETAKDAQFKLQPDDIVFVPERVF